MATTNQSAHCQVPSLLSKVSVSINHFNPLLFILFFRRIQRIDTAEDDDKSGVFVAEAGPIIEWTNGAGNEAVVEDIMLNTNVSLFIFLKLQCKHYIA